MSLKILSLKVNQGHSNLHRCVLRVYKFIFHYNYVSILNPLGACPGGAVGSVAVRGRCLAMVIGDSAGFEARAGRLIVSGYSGLCFEIKFSGRHRGVDGVLF